MGLRDRIPFAAARSFGRWWPRTRTPEGRTLLRRAWGPSPDAAMLVLAALAAAGGAWIDPPGPTDLVPWGALLFAGMAAVVVRQLAVRASEDEVRVLLAGLMPALGVQAAIGCAIGMTGDLPTEGALGWVIGWQLAGLTQFTWSLVLLCALLAASSWLSALFEFALTSVFLVVAFWMMRLVPELVEWAIVFALGCFFGAIGLPALGELARSLDAMFDGLLSTLLVVWLLSGSWLLAVRLLPGAVGEKRVAFLPALWDLVLRDRATTALDEPTEEALTTAGSPRSRS